jgi:Tfp pilus assembly protein PilF
MYRAEPDAALEHLRAVIENPDATVRQRAEAAYSAGQIEVMTDEDLASSDFGKAVSLDPTYPLGYVGRASVTFSQAVNTDSTITPQQRTDMTARSLGDLSKAIQLNPNQSFAHLQLAVELSAIGRQDDAKLIFKGLIEKIIPEDISLSATGKAAMITQVRATEQGLATAGLKASADPQ